MQEMRIEYQATDGEGDCNGEQPMCCGREKLYGEDTSKKIGEMCRKWMTIGAVAKKLGCFQDMFSMY